LNEACASNKASSSLLNDPTDIKYGFDEDRKRKQVLKLAEKNEKICKRISDNIARAQEDVQLAKRQMHVQEENYREILNIIGRLGHYRSLEEKASIMTRVESRSSSANKGPATTATVHNPKGKELITGRHVVPEGAASFPAQAAQALQILDEMERRGLRETDIPLDGLDGDIDRFIGQEPPVHKE